MATLLLVDDEVDLLDALRTILTDEGHEVYAATSAPGALTVIKEITDGSLDIVVTDMLMPEMSGLELLEAVRSQNGLEQLPFLFITASTSLKMEGLLNSKQNVVFLRKPFDVEDLFIKVDETLDMSTAG